MHFSCLVQDVHRRKWTRLWPFLPRCTPPRDGSLPRFEEQGIIPFVLFIPPAEQTDGTRPAFCLPEFIILDKFPSSRTHTFAGYVTRVFPTFFDFIETRRERWMINWIGRDEKILMKGFRLFPIDFTRGTEG